MVSAAKRGLAHRTQCNFYSATAVLALKRVHKVSDNLITQLLPTILYGLSQPSDDQTRVSILMTRWHAIPGEEITRVDHAYLGGGASSSKSTGVACNILCHGIDRAVAESSGTFADQ